MTRPNDRRGPSWTSGKTLAVKIGMLYVPSARRGQQPFACAEGPADSSRWPGGSETPVARLIRRSGVIARLLRALARSGRGIAGSKGSPERAREPLLLHAGQPRGFSRFCEKEREVAVVRGSAPDGRR